MKVCAKCKILKLEKDFHKNKTGKNKQNSGSVFKRARNFKRAA